MDPQICIFKNLTIFAHNATFPFLNPFTCGSSWGKLSARNFYFKNGESSKLKSLLWHTAVFNQSTPRHFWIFSTHILDATAFFVFLGAKWRILPKKRHFSIFEIKLLHSVFIYVANRFRCELDDVWRLNFRDIWSSTTFHSKSCILKKVWKLSKFVNFCTARGKILIMV